MNLIDKNSITITIIHDKLFSDRNLSVAVGLPAGSKRHKVVLLTMLSGPTRNSNPNEAVPTSLMSGIVMPCDPKELSRIGRKLQVASLRLDRKLFTSLKLKTK